VVKFAAVVISALYGLIIGSFLNVVIDRVPKRQSVVTPRSRCPRCEHEISARDNVPLLSWFLLRGRCRFCRLPISWQYPLVEGGTALLFGLTAARFGASWNLALFLMLFVGLIPLAIIDLQQHLLPIRIVYPTLLVEVAIMVADSIATTHWRPLMIAVICGSVWFGAFFIVNFVRPDALGFGDVRLVGLLGLSVGWLGVPEVFVAFFVSNLLGLFAALLLIATNRASRSTPIPFGLFLSLGSMTAILVGPSIVNGLGVAR
jgi:leader peptidase (prepilin peptidase)/N-methyltransferase